MKVAVGSDHAGYRLKKEIVRFLSNEQIQFKDFGVFSLDRADYPDIGVQVGEAVANKEFDRGILICASGIGMSITANKVPGIRAALCSNVECAQLSREHNDSNILVLGERVTSVASALEILRTWLSTDFSGKERYAMRIRKISEIEKRYNGGES